jgi:hypothetical protein
MVSTLDVGVGGVLGQGEKEGPVLVRAYWDWDLVEVQEVLGWRVSLSRFHRKGSLFGQDET